MGEAQNDALRELERELPLLTAFECPGSDWVGEQEFAGCTMWYEKSQAIARLAWQQAWFDWRVIPKFEDEFWPKRNAEESMFLVEPDSIVMTHFLPSYDLVADKYIGTQENVFFVTPDIGEDIISFRKPKLWMFGHTHTWTDKMVHETRCVSRPFGYPRESEKLDYRNWHRDCTFEVTT